MAARSRQRTPRPASPRSLRLRRGAERRRQGRPVEGFGQAPSDLRQSRTGTARSHRRSAASCRDNLSKSYDQQEDTMKAKKMARSYEQKADHITPIEYSVLQQAVDHFNKQLFDGSLPDVFMTYQRKAHSNGSYAPDRYSGRADEIRRGGLSLNPDNFIGQTDEQIAQTLVSLMAECWQDVFGTMRSARGYHNKEWAAKMKAIGLQPSSTGGVGGKETGQRMSSYIIPDGPFANAFTKLAATGWKLNL